MVKTQAWFLPLVTGISDSIEYGIFLEGKCQETAEHFNLYGFMRGGGGRKPQHSISGLLEFSAPHKIMKIYLHFQICCAFVRLKMLLGYSAVF